MFDMAWRRVGGLSSGSLRAVILPLLMCSPALLGPAHAQSGRQSPPIQPADQGLEQRRVERLQETRDRIAVPTARSAPDQTAGEERVLFTLAAVRIEGDSPLVPGAIEAAYRDKLGKPISQADLVALAGEISKLHRDAGYHLTRALIPPQDIKRGIVTIRIVPGTVAELVVQGDEANRFGTRRMLAPIAEEAPARLATLERQLLLVNDLPGVRVKDTTLDEIGAGSGQFRLTVILENWSVFVSAGWRRRAAERKRWSSGSKIWCLRRSSSGSSGTCVKVSGQLDVMKPPCNECGGFKRRAI